VKLSLLPTELKFFDYFEQASANLVEGAVALQEICDSFDNLEERAARITEIEHRGDLIVHEVLNQLPRTLITPIDANDIHRLVCALDDALDALDGVAQRLLIYRLTELKKPACELAHLIAESARALDAAVRGMRHKGTYEEVRANIVQINTLENEGDRVLESALRGLVEVRDDLYQFIVWKEIYERLEAATDRIEDAGDVIQEVMVANA